METLDKISLGNDLYEPESNIRMEEASNRRIRTLASCLRASWYNHDNRMKKSAGVKLHTALQLSIQIMQKAVERTGLKSTRVNADG